MIYAYIISACWIFFIGYWIISSFGVKKDITKKHLWQQGILIRVTLVGVLIYVLERTRSNVFHKFLRDFLGSSLAAHQPALRLIGAILTIVGIGFAVWARIHLGQNWSAAPAIKQKHELVTSGPYRIVRHPIYTGMIAALIGSGLASSVFWLIAALGGLIVFLFRIPIEERYMAQLFPAQYPEYKKHTKALIPFIW